MASTRAYDLFFDNTKFDLILLIWDTELDTHLQSFLCVPYLMTPKKKVTGDNYDPWPFFGQHKIWPNFNICMTQYFSRLPVCVLINDPKKKEIRASTRAYDLFFWQHKIWPNFIDMGHRASNTFAKLPVFALINDLKKKFRKKLYVTIPQWSEAFWNMSHLRSGWNRAKCGLQLNDPIDWFKLR